MKANILEIFESIQGEGKYVGVSQVFVRFFECNMHCVWCDTPHSIGDSSRRYDEYTHEELVQKIDELWRDSHSVSLTGGEPLLQKDFIKELLPTLKEQKRPAHLETNGIFHQELSEIVDDIDVVAMDIKLPSSTKCKEYWQEHKEFLKVALQTEVFIKTVVSSDTDIDDIIQARDLVADIDRDVLFIVQPNSYDMHNGVVKKCLDFQGECKTKLNNVRVLPQVHRFMKLR